MSRLKSYKSAYVYTLAAMLLVLCAILIVRSGVFLPEPEMEAVADNCYAETLHVVTDEDYLPYSFYDSHGHMSGHDLEVITLLANEMKMNLDVRFENWGVALRDFETGEADLLLTCDYFDVFEGAENLIKSEPISIDEFVVYSKSNIRSTDELYGKRIAVMENANVLPYLDMLGVLDRCVMWASNKDAMTAVENGDADCAIMRYTVGEAIIKEQRFKDISTHLSIGKSYICIDLRGDDRELADRLNIALGTLRDNGELSRLHNKWLTSFVHEYTLWELISANVWVFVGFILVIVGGMFLYVRSERRRRREKEKEAIKTRKEQIAKMTGGVSSYIVNPFTERFQILSQDAHLSANYPEAEDFRTSITRYINSDVYAPDRKAAAEGLSLETMIRRLEHEDEYNFKFRDISSGSPRWYELRAVRLSDNEILYGFSDRDDEIIKNQIFKKLEDDFFAMFYLNMDSAMIEILKDAPGMVGAKGTLMPLENLMEKMEAQFDGDAQEFFTRNRHISFLRQRFRIEDKSVFLYKSNLDGGNRWGTVTEFVLERHEDGVPALLLIGFSLLDEEATEKEELKFELQAARDAAEAANRSKTNFLFNMSHDIRTPMNAITGFTTMAKKYIDDKDKVFEYLDKIDTSGQQLLGLINQVLEMARIESGRVELEEEPVSISDEFNALTTVFAEQAKINGLEFNYVLQNIRHNRVLADRARVNSIVLNIIGNAMKYTPRGGKIDFTFREIRQESANAVYAITVQDTGIGMSEEYLKVLFEPFTRENSSTVSKIQGTGLGMSIVKDMVDLMGGHIAVRSKPHEGTRFDITICLKIDAEYEKGAAEQSSAGNGAAGQGSAQNGMGSAGNGTGEPGDAGQGAAILEGKRVLLVEDNELNREIAVDMLGDIGLVIDTAEDGTVAVEKMRENGPDFYDFILMDVQMPVMNGYDATKTIRTMYPDSHIPIIALSANAFSEDRAASLSAGMDDHVAKPIRVAELTRVIERFM